jgi:BirA family biotin operon repressor/biotin-[acetyl-CoA-carboxylase] ligase
MKRKDTLYAILLEHAGTYYSGEALAAQLGISRAAVWKAVQTLRTESNVPILSHAKLGYCIPADADLLTEAAVQKQLHTKHLGRNLKKFTTVDSTNTVCKQLAAEGAAHGTVVAADGQSAGRGRMGRVFCSPIHTGLYFSVILREDLSMPTAQQVTCCAAVAVAEAIEALYDLPAQIKWVNDIYYQGKKLCGILTEAAWNCEAGQMDYMVVGIGINIRKTECNLPPELHNMVSSLEESGCVAVHRSDLLAEILNRLEAQLAVLPQHGFLEAYRQRSCLTGQRVTAWQGTQQRTGVVTGIADDGALLLQTETGETIALQSGEVTLHTQA